MSSKLTIAAHIIDTDARFSMLLILLICQQGKNEDKHGHSDEHYSESFHVSPPCVGVPIVV